MKKPLHAYVLFDFVSNRIIGLYSNRKMAQRAELKFRCHPKTGEVPSTAVLKFSVAGASILSVGYKIKALVAYED